MKLPSRVVLSLLVLTVSPSLFAQGASQDVTHGTSAWAIGLFGLFLVLFIANLGGKSSQVRQLYGTQLRIERKLDALLKHQGIEIPCPLSPEVRALATSGSKIAAIKLHREQAGLSLLDAKNQVEAFQSGA